MSTTKAIMNEWREYSEYYELFENHAYIENILGIKPLLTESGAPYYDSKTKKKIIEEHLLLEGVLDYINPIQIARDRLNLVKLAKEWGPDRVRILWPLFQIATNPKHGPSFGEHISKYSLNPTIENIQGWIDWAQQKGIQILANTLQMVKDKITSLTNMAAGWKKTLALVGGAGALAFLQWGLDWATGGLISLLKKNIPAIKDLADWTAKWDAVKEKVTEWIADKFMEVLEKLLGAATVKSIETVARYFLPGLLEVLKVSKNFGDLLKDAIARFDTQIKIASGVRRSGRRQERESG